MSDKHNVVRNVGMDTQAKFEVTCIVCPLRDGCNNFSYHQTSDKCSLIRLFKMAEKVER